MQTMSNDQKTTLVFLGFIIFLFTLAPWLVAWGGWIVFEGLDHWYEILPWPTFGGK